MLPTVKTVRTTVNTQGVRQSHQCGGCICNVSHWSEDGYQVRMGRAGGGIEQAGDLATGWEANDRRAVVADEEAAEAMGVGVMLVFQTQEVMTEAKVMDGPVVKRAASKAFINISAAIAKHPPHGYAALLSLLNLSHADSLTPPPRPKLQLQARRRNELTAFHFTPSTHRPRSQPWVLGAHATAVATEMAVGLRSASRLLRSGLQSRDVCASQHRATASERRSGLTNMCVCGQADRKRGCGGRGADYPI